MSSGTSCPADMILFGLHAQLGLGVARRAEHVAGGQVGDLVRVDQSLGLGSFAGARRADEDDSHG